MPSRGEQSYRMGIRGAARGLWMGALTYAQAHHQMELAIRIYIRQAWIEAGQSCGVWPAEWTQQETWALQWETTEQVRYVDAFLTAVAEGSRERGGKLGPLLTRCDSWVARYGQIRERGKSMICADRPLVWVYGDTKIHCSDCSRVAGKVYRLSAWDRYGWIPGSAELACGGWRCRCSRVDTDRRCTPGRPPAIRGA